MDVVDDPQLLQRLQGAVDGGEVDGGEAGLDRRGDLLRRHMPSGPEHRFDDGLAAGGAPSAGGGEAGEDLLDSIPHGAPLAAHAAFVRGNTPCPPGTLPAVATVRICKHPLDLAFGALAMPAYALKA